MTARSVRIARPLALVLAALASLALLATWSGACAPPPEDATIGIVTPDPAQFPPVSMLLDRRCGSLDCHGARTRNLQIYGCEGLRLGDASPGCRNASGTDTTAEEHDATFRSLVALEPAVMTAVVLGKGGSPELLTFVRKARGTEAHKGGTLVTPGDDQDVCITSWLAGTTDADACARGLAAPVIAR
ncbi:MAG: hypothetical protein JWP87_2525 [Labilithrix sp.]|nr:hypothetical protein [Labilithrix sp.]